MKPLIIGEAPSKNAITDRPIEGRIGKRLASAAGLSYERFLDHFDRANLLSIRQDVVGTGFTFNILAAKVAASRLAEKFEPGQIVLLLGGRVSESFGLHSGYFEEHVVNEACVYILPHPSGINRWFNDPRNMAQMTTFMQSIVERTNV